MRSAVTLVCLLALSDVVTAEPRIVVNTQEALVGEDSGLGIRFESRLQAKDIVVLELSIGDKRITAIIDYGQQSLRISSSSSTNAGPIYLSIPDSENLTRLQGALSIHGGSRVQEALISLLTWLDVLGPGAPVDFEPAAGVPSQQSFTSICDFIDDGQIHDATYTAKKMTFTVGALVGHCSEDSPTTTNPLAGACLGRCGPGCKTFAFDPGADPAAVQRFTQECLNHDACTRQTGGGPGKIGLIGSCFDEFRAATPGYFFAPDCAAISGAYNVTIDATTCLQGQCNPVSGSLPLFNFTSASLSFDGVSTPNGDGKSSEFKGKRQGLNGISGSWSIPIYMSLCSGTPFLGYAQGTFNGTNACGKSLTIDLSGGWPWYLLPPECVPEGTGTLEGTSLATQETSSAAEQPPTAASILTGSPSGGIHPGAWLVPAW